MAFVVGERLRRRQVRRRASGAELREPESGQRLLGQVLSLVGQHRHRTRAFSRLRALVEWLLPHDRNSLLGAIEAAQHGIITPILVGPEAKIRAVATMEQVDLAPYRIVSTEHSHAAADQAVAMARAGEVEG